MKKIALSIVAVTALLSASEIEYGSGTINMTGGFLGLVGSMGTDVSTYTLAERHSNIASDFFYSYDLTWYDSKTLNQAQNTYNNTGVVSNGFLGLNANEYMKIPAMQYKLQGLDVNVRLGYDVIHKDADNFLGLGVLVGVSIPWIESSQNANSNDSFIKDNAGTILTTADYFKDSKTKIMTYKIGPSINFQKTLISDKLSIYGIGSYAYQTGYMKNDYMNSKLTVNGTFQEINLGLYYTPFTENYKLGWLTLSPRVYGTVGYKYTKWDMDEVAIDISGANLDSSILDPLATKFGMDSSVVYAGVGYSF